MISAAAHLLYFWQRQTNIQLSNNTRSLCQYGILIPIPTQKGREDRQKHCNKHSPIHTHHTHTHHTSHSHLSTHRHTLSTLHTSHQLTPHSLSLSLPISISYLSPQPIHIESTGASWATMTASNSQPSDGIKLERPKITTIIFDVDDTLYDVGTVSGFFVVIGSGRKCPEVPSIKSHHDGFFIQAKVICSNGPSFNTI